MAEVYSYRVDLISEFALRYVFKRPMAGCSYAMLRHFPNSIQYSYKLFGRRINKQQPYKIRTSMRMTAPSMKSLKTEPSQTCRSRQHIFYPLTLKTMKLLKPRSCAQPFLVCWKRHIPLVYKI